MSSPKPATKTKQKSLPRLLEGVPSDLDKDYEVLELLGEGNFAKVKKAKNRKTNQFVAVKLIEKKAVVSDVKQLEALIGEISIMKNLSHPNIIRLLDVYETSDKLCLIMELVTGGELFDKIVDQGAYSEREASILMLSLFRAIKYLHDKGVAHRDLKPENILYENKNPTAAVKIADFGLSKVIDKRKMMETCCGTPGYVAPEVLAQSGYGPEVDMWSLGILMYVLLCGFPPFYDENDSALFDQIQSGKFEFVSPYWDEISKHAKDLITRLLVVDPKKRLSAGQCLKHPWFSVALPSFKLEQAQAKLKETKAKGRWRGLGMMAVIATKLGEKKK